MLYLPISYRCLCIIFPSYAVNAYTTLYKHYTFQNWQSICRSCAGLRKKNLSICLSPSFIIQPVCNMSVSPTPSVTLARLCVCIQGCTDKIIHCYPTSVFHCFLFSILPPVVYHHFHSIITPTPPGSLPWLLSKWDQSRSVSTQVWEYSHL